MGDGLHDRKQVSLHTFLLRIARLTASCISSACWRGENPFRWRGHLDKLLLLARSVT